MRRRKTTPKPGIGLYTAEQEKNTTAFDYFAEVVVGAIVASLGVMLGYDQYHSATRRTTEGLLIAAALIVVGIFFAHAGVIFWCRRIRRL